MDTGDVHLHMLPISVPKCEIRILQNMQYMEIAGVHQNPRFCVLCSRDVCSHVNFGQTMNLLQQIANKKWRQTMYFLVQKQAARLLEPLGCMSHCNLPIATVSIFYKTWFVNRRLRLTGRLKWEYLSCKESCLPRLSSEPRRHTETANHGNDVFLSVDVWFWWRAVYPRTFSLLGLPPLFNDLPWLFRWWGTRDPYVPGCNLAHLNLMHGADRGKTCS